MNIGYGSALKPARSVDYEAMKRQGFRDQSILVVDINDRRLTWPEREFLQQIGRKLYGEGKKS